MPSDLLGNIFFLRLAEADDGGVWFWCYYQGKDPHTELVRAADSFIDLIARTEAH